MIGRPGRKRKQLLVDLKQSSRYCELKKKKKKHYISFCGELTLKEAMDLS